MKIYYLNGTTREASLSQRLMAGVAVVAGLGLFALLLTVGLVVGLIALGLGVLAIAIAALRQRWRGVSGGTGTRRTSQQRDPRQGPAGSKEGAHTIDGEYVVIRKPGVARGEQQRSDRD